MTATTTPPTREQYPDAQTKPPWRYARERRLGKRARALVGSAEAEIARCLTTLGADAVLGATRADSWALACLERAADCDDASEEQQAWVLLAACRPTLVRRAVFGRRVPRTLAGPCSIPGAPSPAQPQAADAAPLVGWRAQLAEIGAQLRAREA